MSVSKKPPKQRFVPVLIDMPEGSAFDVQNLGPWRIGVTLGLDLEGERPTQAITMIKIRGGNFKNPKRGPRQLIITVEFETP